MVGTIGTVETRAVGAFESAVRGMLHQFVHPIDSIHGVPNGGCFSHLKRDDEF